MSRWVVEPAFAPVTVLATIFTSAFLYVIVGTVSDPESQRLYGIVFLVLFAIIAAIVIYYLMKRLQRA